MDESYARHTRTVITEAEKVIDLLSIIHKDLMRTVGDNDANYINDIYSKYRDCEPMINGDLLSEAFDEEIKKSDKDSILPVSNIYPFMLATAYAVQAMRTYKPENKDSDLERLAWTLIADANFWLGCALKGKKDLEFIKKQNEKVLDFKLQGMQEVTNLLEHEMAILNVTHEIIELHEALPSLNALAIQTKAAVKRHGIDGGTWALKREAIAFFMADRSTYKSIAQAATAITKQVPLSYRTANDYISEHIREIIIGYYEKNMDSFKNKSDKDIAKTIYNQGLAHPLKLGDITKRINKYRKEKKYTPS